MKKLFECLRPDKKFNSYLDDPDFDKKMNDLSEFLKNQQEKLLALYDEGPDEFDPETIFGNEINDND